jgi:uncharacterized protein involved in exopolysaccharide biosynthesis
LLADNPNAEITAAEAGAIRSDVFGWFVDVTWRYRLTVLAVFALVMAGAVFYLHQATYKYTAELRVTAVYSSQQLPSGLGGIASLAGINLPGDKQVSPIALYGEAMRSRDVADAVVADKVLMQHLFADEWDAASGAWREQPSLRKDIVRAAKRLLGVPDTPWSEPDSADVQRHLARNLAIIDSAKTNVTTVAVNDPDPAMAARLLSTLNTAADRHIRERALARASEYIVYLERKLLEVQVAEYRQSLVQALSAQERIRMMASTGAPYSAEPLGRIIVSTKPTTPKPAVVLIAGVLFGLILGILAAVLRHLWARRGQSGARPS